MPNTLADDLLHGAEAIAEFLFGDRKARRKVYHLAETSNLPTFHLGGKVCARRSVLIAWIARQEKRGWRGNSADSAEAAREDSQNPGGSHEEEV